MRKQDITVIWLMRDLRLRDHKPLYEAVINQEHVILLYCWEPSFMGDPHMSERHWHFVSQSLEDIDSQLPDGICILQMHMEVTQALQTLQHYFNIGSVRSYQEIGLKALFPIAGSKLPYRYLLTTSRKKGLYPSSLSACGNTAKETML